MTTRTGGRDLKVRVKTGKSRTLSSKLWLDRQLNDPYVARAKREGFRSRAAYKLIEIDDKHHFLKAGARVVDLGAAPGGWSQIAAKRMRRGRRQGARGRHRPARRWRRFRASISPGSIFSTPTRRTRSRRCSAAPPMSCSPTWRRMRPAIARPIISRSWRWWRPRPSSPREVLAPGGAFLCKVLQGGTETTLLAALKRDFTTVKHVKPAASRSDSAELYLLATGFRGVGRMTLIPEEREVDVSKRCAARHRDLAAIASRRIAAQRSSA